MCPKRRFESFRSDLRGRAVWELAGPITRRSQVQVLLYPEIEKKVDRLEGGEVANEKNLKPVRTKSEARERGRNGGKASGEARRRKADFRKTLNMLLTAEIENEEYKPILEALGVECTLESALNMAMIKEGLSGNVKAYEAIAKYAGQSNQTERDDEEQKIRTDRAKRARDMEVGDTDTSDENIQSFLKAMRPTQEDLEDLFSEDENKEVETDGEETEETS